MKIEIKNISLKSIILSAFPLLVFALCLVNYVLQVANLPDLNLLDKIVQIILWSLVDTIIWLVFITIAVFAYNLLCSFGIKGLVFTIEEPGVKEEEIKAEEKQEIQQETKI